jgi:hypothetical protein
VMSGRQQGLRLLCRYLWSEMWQTVASDDPDGVRTYRYPWPMHTAVVDVGASGSESAPRVVIAVRLVAAVLTTPARSVVHHGSH